MTPMRAAGGFDLQGHRGARGLWPENTLAGFSRALDIGVSTLELDCAVTRDGVVVISHDPVLNPDHTRDAQGAFLRATGPPITTLSFTELRQYDVGRLRPGSEYAARFPEQQAVDGERIPRLADLYALVAARGDVSVRFNVETKVYPDRPELTVTPELFAERLLAVVLEAGMAARTTIQSFDWRTLSFVHRHAPQVATVALTDQQGEDDTVWFGRQQASPWLGGLDANDYDGSMAKLVAASGARIWSPNHLDVDAQRVAECHALGLTVVPWTINDASEMHRLIALGVDGLISDRPDLLRAVLLAEGLAVPPASAAAS